MTLPPPACCARSRVVDSAGDPMPVFHWTDMGEFESFQVTHDIGFHFGTRQSAENRAAQVRGPTPASSNEWMITAYLRIEHPLELPDLHDWNPQSVIGALLRSGVLHEADDTLDVIIDREWTRDQLRSHGFDGISYQNFTEGGGRSWIALSPDQIHIAHREPLTLETP